MASRSGHATSLYLKLLKTVEAQGMTVVQPSTKPRKIELGSVELTIFPQPPEDRKEENNNSVGLRLRYGSFSMLLDRRQRRDRTPVVAAQRPRAWCATARFSSLPITAAGTEPTRAGCKLVRPELAVASMGRNNEYGHPHAETVSLLRRSGIPFLRTDQLGTITITSDGRDWQVVEPSIARTGRPTQADVDRVAAATEDDIPREGRPNSNSLERLLPPENEVQERLPPIF